MMTDEPVPVPVPDPLPAPEPMGCPSVITDGDATFRCSLAAGHIQRHKGDGAEWEDDPAPRIISRP